MKSNLKSMCRGCRFSVAVDEVEGVCSNPDMSRLDVAEAITETFFGGRCRGYEKMPE